MKFDQKMQSDVVNVVIEFYIRSALENVSFILMKFKFVSFENYVLKAI